MSFVDPFAAAKAQQAPPIHREISYPGFGWAVQRNEGVIRLVMIDGSGTAHVFPMSPIDFARFKRDCEQAAPSVELN